jgi:hypothetical protein
MLLPRLYTIPLFLSICFFKSMHAHGFTCSHVSIGMSLSCITDVSELLIDIANDTQEAVE